jgi:acetoin utilization deacetylase AcuC-like enzyme
LSGTGKVTAFVSHSDCARHDPGWNHPDHQGRLPGLMREVYRDMLTLFEPLLEVEGRHASEEELRLVHGAGYLERLRGWSAEAEARGGPFEVMPGLFVSSATWAASLAAAGSPLVAIDEVLAVRVRNAFCPVRPPARDAVADRPGRFGFVNPLAIAVLSLLGRSDVERVLVVEWGDSSSIAPLLAGVAGARCAAVGGSGSGFDTSPDRTPGAAGASLATSVARVLDRALADFTPDFVLLSAGFEWLRGDPLGGRTLEPRDFFEATRVLREVADAVCDGRLVSILEGGYDPTKLGAASVQHLRALAGLPPA